VSGDMEMLVAASAARDWSGSMSSMVPIMPATTPSDTLASCLILLIFHL
jgi:hypothetical protein